MEGAGDIGWLEDDWMPDVVQEVQSQGFLFQLLPPVRLLSVHFLWNIRRHCLQLRGWFLTWVAVSSMVEEQNQQDQFSAEDKMALLTLSIDC